MQYLFAWTYPKYPFIGRDHRNYEFSKNFVRLWVHFATHRTTSGLSWKYGGRSSILKWKKLDRAAALRGQPLQLMEFNNDIPEMIEEPFKDRADFFDTLPVTE